MGLSLLPGPPRLRFLITSVLSESGRVTPCSFKKRPQALHKGKPSGSRRQSGVWVVLQLEQTVGGSAPAIVLESPLLLGGVVAAGALLFLLEAAAFLGSVLLRRFAELDEREGAAEPLAFLAILTDATGAPEPEASGDGWYGAVPAKWGGVAASRGD